MLEFTEIPIDERTQRRLSLQREFLQKRIQERLPSLLVFIWPIAGVLMAAGVFYFWRSFWAIFIPIAASLMMLGRRMNMISDREITRQTLMHVEQQLAAPTLRVMHVQATEFWKINEVEDEGATYIFKVGERQWLLIHGQDFAPQKRFPSMEFKIVMGISDSLIQIKGLGEKSEPTRVLPANKNGVLSPIGKFYLVVDAEENIVIQTLENEIERGYRQV